jgi:hypothetical protein
MAKKRISEYVFRAGLSKAANLFPKAYAIIQANIDFIIAEEIAYIDYNIAEGIAPYIGFQYDPSTCERDVGYYLNAYLNDLRYGGNIETRNVANYLWIDGVPQIGTAALAPVLATHAFIKTLINNYVLTNTTPTTVYQTDVEQVIITTSTGELGAAARISSLIDIITGVISNGTPAIPVAVPGVGQIRLQGKYSAAELLLVTNTTKNEIIYNFSDPALGADFSYKFGTSSGGGSTGGITDLDFPRYLQTTDGITTINLLVDTSTMLSVDDIQIFVEDDVTTIRPWDFGTDAIERMRVSTPQAMLDADFEYGLQPTKWQAIALQRGYPAVYEIPGSDTPVSTVTTDASIPTGSVGNSLITVTTIGPHGFTLGQPITIKALASTISGFSRAEGSFLIFSVPSENSFTYYASAKVGTSSGQILATTYTQLRKAAFYTGAAIGAPTLSVYSNGVTSTITSQGITPSGSTSILFTGTAPSIGASASGFGLVIGTQVTGVIGAGGLITTSSVDTGFDAGVTEITLASISGVVEGAGLDNGTGTSLFITNIVGNTITLSGAMTVGKDGDTQTYTGVSGTNINSIGTGATFDISLSGGTYSAVINAGNLGADYALGDIILISGANIGGASPANNLTLTVSSIGVGGAISTVTTSGTGVSVDGLYAFLTYDSSTTVSGANFTPSVTREDGTGTYTINIEVAGLNYLPAETITVLGTQLGGASPANDLVITIDTVDVVGGVETYTLSGTGISGDQSFTNQSGTNQTPTGTSASFSIQRSGGAYSVTSITPGSLYTANARIRILGSLLGGVDTTNDAVVVVNSVNGSGGIATASASGTALVGGTIDLYSVVEISEATSTSMPALTVLNVGAIPTLQASFANNHGLLPGSGILVNITSNPPPAFTSAGTVPLSSSGTWTGVTYALGKWIAIQSGGTAGASSTDLTSWTPLTISQSATWTSIASGLVGATTHIVAVASGGTATTYSTNGTSWTNGGALSSSGTWTAVTYSNGIFMAVRSGSNAASRSENGGVGWTAGGALSTSSTWTDVAGGLINGVNVFVAIASGGTLANYSVDLGTTWAATGVLPSSATWSSIAYGNFRFVAIASGGTASAYSTTGLAWVAGGALPASTTWSSIGFHNGLFVAVATGTASIATSYDGVTWTLRTLTTTANWGALAGATINNTNKWAIVGNGTAAQSVTLTPNNHAVAAGPFLVTEVPSETTIRWVARAQLAVDTSELGLAGVIYARPDSFFVHRPYDGGVQLGTGSPQHGAQAVRQSKKYIRYQSGKGMMYTTGALFAPSYSLASGTAESLAINSLITFTTDDTDHGCQIGGTVEITGFQTASYNGTYVVDSIVNERAFKVRSLRALSSLTASLGNDPKMSVRYWHGATVRSGPFDEQNGIFYQYDGQTLALGKRSSTFQLTGVASVNVDSNLVTGTGTRFRDQLKAGDRIVLKGMSHVVTKVINDTSITINPDYRGVTNATLAKLCLTQDTIIPQKDWNLDRGDGTGPSGYNIDPTKMQMIGMQYTWYAAGFIEFMLRGSDGKFIFLHRIRNSNVNTEAYMRTANLPVRYEVINESARDKLISTINSSQTTIPLYDAYYFPNEGTVIIDNEMISYTAKSGNTLTGCSRGSTYQNFASGSNRTYSAGAAASHTVNTGVILISTTITPVISHWGSALLTDGQFDQDRGYLFSYASTGNDVSTTKKTAFLIRLAPSVSNAIVGDLGERELLNRAQLLLKEIAIASDAVATNTGGIVIEGVLNPQNYPINPADISWGGIAGLAQGGQPSFVQIAPGGSVNWASGVVQTTATATSAAGINLNRTNYLYFSQTSWDAIGAKVGTEVSDSKFPAGTRVTQVFGPANYVGGAAAGNEYLVYFNQNSNTNITGGSTVTFTFGQPPYALPGETVFSFITNPGETSSLDLNDLKELTNTTLGGRGTYPNGPDVLAINVYKTGGTATVANIILRWGEAQA